MKAKEKCCLLVGIITTVITLSLIIADLCLYCSKGTDLIIFRIIEILSASLATASFSISISTKISINKAIIKENSKNNKSTKIIIKGDLKDNEITISADNSDSSKDLSIIKADMELLKQENVNAICEMVYQRIKNEENLKAIDKDFTVKYLNEAGNISDSDIQKIWAEILVSKVVDGTSVTKRLLDIVKNLSSNEAKIFEKVSKCAVNDGTIYKLFDDDLPFEDISLMTEIGFLKPHDLLSNQFKFESASDKTIVARNSKLAVVVTSNNDHGEEISFSCHALTNEGLLLKSILKYEISDEDIRRLCEYIKKETEKKNIKVELNPVIKIENGMVELNPNDLLEDIDSN